MAFIFIWLLFGIIGAAILGSHDRAGCGCLVGALLGPLGIVLALVEKMRLDRLARQRMTPRYELVVSPQPPAIAAPPRVERDCPHCAERILAKATVCKHCGRDVFRA